MGDKIDKIFKIETITEKDIEEVYEFSYQNFIKDEPLNKSVNLKETPEMKSYILSSLNQNCSFKIVNDDGKIIGLVISAIVKRPEIENFTKLNKPQTTCEDCEDVKKPVKFIDYVDSQWNIFEKYQNIDKYLNGKLVAVDINYRGLGIAGQLIDQCRKYMSDNQIPIMKRICTSEFSGKVMKRLGMKEVSTIYYDEFKINGKVFLKPDEPHVACRTFIMEI